MTKALSFSWAASHHRALGSSTNPAVRLAIALGAIKSIVRVVDRTTPPMSVDWARVDESGPVKSMSYTDFKGHAIHLNPVPMSDTSISHGQALDVCVGFGLHEASHSQESRDRYKYLIKREVYQRPNARPDTAEDMAFRRVITNPATTFDQATGQAVKEVPAFEPLAVAAYLWNLVEDVRIERATGKRWPGFVAYFGAVLDWMWKDMRKRHDLPTQYGPELKDKLRVVFLACRYPAVELDPALRTEAAWWHTWQRDYLSNAVDTPTTIQRGLDHLAEDAVTKQELEKLASSERKEREAGERLRAQLDRLIRDGIKGTFEVCTADNGELIPLDAETAAEVDKLVRENLVEHAVLVTGQGVSNPATRVRKPEETAASRRAYIGRPDAETDALRAALVFRASAPEYAEKLLKSGQIDDEELYRWGAGDYRVFGERVIESKPDVFLGLLVDASGSMYGRGLEIAQHLAQLFVWATHDAETVQTAVWAHTADIDEPGTEVYRIWERGDPLSRLGLIHEIEHANNRDGHAIAEVVNAIQNVEQAEKVLLVLSDGLPSGSGYGSGYGGRAAEAHVRSVQRWALSRGVRVIQIAIDPDGLRPEDQARMFGQEGEGWIGFRSYAALPRQITSLLGRYV